MILKRKPYRVSIVLGRFQVFHKAHKRLLDEAFTLADIVLVVLGSHQAALNIKNPFTTDEREEMIRKVYPDRDIHFVVVPDHMYDDDRWLLEVQAKVRQKITALGIETEIVIRPWEDRAVAPPKVNKDICICGYYKDSSSYYLDYYKNIWGFETHVASINISSTDIRTALFTDGRVQPEQSNLHWAQQVPDPVVDWVSANFLGTPKFDYLKEEYDFLVDYKEKWNPTGDRQWITGDAIVVQNGLVLMVIRKNMPGKGLWALPGGFIKKTETIDNGVLRELKEETVIGMHKHELRKHFVGSAVFDHPDRDLRGRIVTHGHFFKLGKDIPLPHVKGSDDALKAFWVPINEVIQNAHNVYGDHIHILNYLSRFN